MMQIKIMLLGNEFALPSVTPHLFNTVCGH